MRLKSQNIEVLMKVSWKSCIVICNHVQSRILRLRMSSLELPKFVQKHDKNQTQLSFF